MITVLKETLLGESFAIVTFALAAGVILLFARPRWGRVWLASLAAGLLFVSVPAGADLLARSLDPQIAPLARAADAQSASAVVLLGAGSANTRFAGLQFSTLRRPGALRALEAARLYRLLGDPLIVVSGGVTERADGAAAEADAYRMAMVALGVPAARIVDERESHNTREEAVVLKRLFAERRITRFVIVTSPLHMPRALATFAAEGLHPVASPAPLYPDGPRPPMLIPNDGALELSQACVYEWLARAYYRARGWTRAPA
jgi:uncharacterized SAM-binding protein YcdF (DUF218 family)